MNDTSTEVQNIQRKIFEKKTLTERFQIGAETIDFGRLLVVNSIKKNNPEISEIELKIAILKRYYGTTFTETELNTIIQSMIIYYNRLNDR
jgi:hypothetical protein